MKKIIIFTFLLLLISVPIEALESSKSVGLGNFATIEGIDGIYLNPATVNADNDFFSFDSGLNAGFGNNLLNNEYISEDKKDKLLNKIDKSGWIIDMKAKSGFNIAVGPIALFSNIRGEGIMRFNPDVAELVLAGNETDVEYYLDDSFGSGALYNDSGINLSLKIPEDYVEKTKNNIENNENFKELKNIYVGMNFKLLNGIVFEAEGDGSGELGYTEEGSPTVSGNGEFIVKHTDIENLEGIDDLGNGTAFDIGLYGDYNEDISFGLSILNLGSISSNDGLYKKYTFDSNSEEVFKLEGEGTLEELSELEGEEQKIEYQLPRKINIGGEYRYREDLKILANYSNINYKEFNDNKLSVGAEYTRLKFLPLRVGTEYSSLDNDIKIRSGMGIYLGPVKTDIGISDLLGLFNKSKGLEIAINSGFSF